MSDAHGKGDEPELSPRLTKLLGVPWPKGATMTLFALMLVAFINNVDRHIIGLAIPFITFDGGNGRPLGTKNDTELGLISSLIGLNVLLAIPIARLADRYSRRNIIAIGMLAWSGLTASFFLITSQLQWIFGRFFVGAFEATSGPASNAMVSDIFSKAALPLALSIMLLGDPLAYIIGYPISGWLIDNYGWRMMFVALGLPGILAAALFFVMVKEPKRAGSLSAKAAREQRKADQPTFIEAMRDLLKSPAFVLTTLAAAFMRINMFGVFVWSFLFLKRNHHLTATELGFWVGMSKGAVGIIGVLLGGYLAMRFGKTRPKWRAIVPAICFLLVIPADILFAFAPTTPLSLLGYTLVGLLHGAWVGPVYAVAMGAAQPRVRATAAAVFMLFAQAVGSFVGPPMMGFLNDALKPAFGADAARFSLCAGGVMAGIAAILLFAASRYVRDEDAVPVPAMKGAG